MAFSSVWIAIASLIAVFNITKAVDKDGNIIEPSYELVSGLIWYDLLPFILSHFAKLGLAPRNLTNAPSLLVPRRQKYLSVLLPMKRFFDPQSPPIALSLASLPHIAVFLDACHWVSIETNYYPVSFQCLYAPKAKILEKCLMYRNVQSCSSAVPKFLSVLRPVVKFLFGSATLASPC